MNKKKGISQKSAIIETAAKLFNLKGYEQTSIDEIIAEKGIAKGTFYYYFHTKEDLLFSVISFLIEDGVERARQIAFDAPLSPQEKLIQVIACVNQNQIDKVEMMKQLHQVNNMRMHQEISLAAIRQLTPLLTHVIEEGIAQGVFHTPYPKECVEMYLTISRFLLDDSLYHWTQKESLEHVQALLYLMQTSLQASDQSFEQIKTYFTNGEMK